MTPDKWTELEELAKAASVTRAKHADQLSAYADWLKFAGSAKPQVILQLIAMARSEAVLRKHVKEIAEAKLCGNRCTCSNCEALAASDKLRGGGG